MATMRDDALAVALALGEKLDHGLLVDDLRRRARRALASRPSAMNFDGLGAGGCGPLVGVVVGLVADERAVGVVRERHADLDEVVEAAQGADALGQGVVAVAAAEGGEGLGEVLGGVGDAGARAHLVVGLLVGAAHAGGAQAEAAGDDEDVFLAGP